MINDRTKYMIHDTFLCAVSIMKSILNVIVFNGHKHNMLCVMKSILYTILFIYQISNKFNDRMKYMIHDTSSFTVSKMLKRRKTMFDTECRYQLGKVYTWRKYYTLWIVQHCVQISSPQEVSDMPESDTLKSIGNVKYQT